MCIYRTEGLFLILLFIFGGILPSGSQEISIRDETCIKKRCSCCINATCKPLNDNCKHGCISGYHGDRCINQCPDNCTTCIDQPNKVQTAHCLTCKNGYFSTTENYQCQSRCSNGCMICESSTNCTSCKDMYYLSNTQPGSCIRCPIGCMKCISEHECHSCDQGYFLSTYMGILRICKKCPIGCASCSSAENCTICETGYYGKTCKDSCSEGCQNNYCLKDDGKCICKTGFSGDKCDTCLTGKYGPGCNRNCSTNCLHDKCKRESGECFSCDEPYDGPFCENCTKGKYGLFCNSSCPEFCFPSICSRFTGFCYNCKRNHVGDMCENCKAGKYGDSCNFDCPQNCLDGHCDRNNGTCFNCSGNTYGLKCDRCRETFYGAKCLQQCSANCHNLTCDHDTGVCDYGCEDGFSGDKCCLNNSYCENCSINEICTECISGKFGERCEDNCIDICIDQKCDKKRGVCVSKSPNLAAILASVVVTVIVIVVVAVLVLLRKRFIYPFLKKYTESTADTQIIFSRLKADDRNGKQIREDEKLKSKPITYEDDGINHKVKINQIATYVFVKTKDSYTKEFKNLPDGLIKPCTDARKPENIAKNRYQSIYPYDEHRVKLTGPGSDFINACYIDGFNKKKEYIASLGPIMKATENFILFWRMLWQEKVEKIVMVTNLIENGTMKCEQYWPTVGNTDCYGDISVTCHSEDVYSDYTRRTFTVAKGKVQRSLTHLHFTAWPDKGVPDDVTSLIEFRQKVIATKVTLGGPTIVHCSAGVGRTGTFIALDRLTKEGEKERAVDVFKCVYNMRQQRTKMVQTEDQYEYLHHAIVHSLTFGCDAIPAEKFKQYMASCSDKDMQSKFEQLNNNKEKLSEKETNAVINNKQREELNRSGADIPGNCHRIWLYEGRTSEEVDYINAVYINGYKQKNRYIVAQTPLPCTVADFITMVIQERISCILSMDVGNSMDKNVGRYIPNDNQTLTIGQFEISSSKVASNKCYTLKKITVCCKAKAIVRTVPHYQCTHWSDNKNVPADRSLFLQLIRDVEKKADKDPNKGPILVHCLNGAERSGLFCAVSIMLQKMEIEHEVSVVNTLRQLKVRRALAIPNKEQYVFCHECVSSYLDTFEDNVYSNFALQRK